MESAPNADRNIDSNRESNCNEKKLNEMRVHDSPDLREGEFDFDEAHAPLALLGKSASLNQQSLTSVRYYLALSSSLI